MKRPKLSTAQIKLWLTASIAVATLIGGVTLQVFRDRQTVLEATEQTTEQLALTLEASVRGFIQSAELVADHVGTLTLPSLSTAGVPSGEAVGQWVDILGERTFMNAIAFVRPDGTVPVAAVRWDEGDVRLLQEQVDLSNWQAFAVHQDRSDRELFVAAARRSAFFDRWIVSLTRPLRDDSDELLGVVYVDIALEAISGLFSEVLPEGNNSVALFNRDATLLFSYPFYETIVGSSYADISLFQYRLNEASNGTYQSRSRVQNDLRILSYRSVDGWPLVLTVDHSVPGVLAPWRTRTFNSILFVGGASFVIFGLTFWMNAQLRRDEENKEILRVREQSLEESQRLANIGHFERDIKSGEFKWADNMYKIHGVSPETFVPGRKSFLSLVVDEARGMVGDRVHHLDSPPSGGHLECRIRRPSDGEIRYIVYDWEVISDRSGQPIKSFGVAQDVTAARDNELTLRESEARLRDITECISDFIWETDKDNKLTVFDSGQDLPRFEVTGHAPGTGFVDTREGPGDRTLVRESIEKRKPFRNLILPLRAEGEAISWVRISGNPRFSHDGEFEGFRGAGTDVTEQHNKRIVEQERNKSEALARLAGGMAHEINNLLQPVIVYSSMGESEDPQASHAQGYFGKIYSASQQAIRIVQDVLTFAREGRVTPNVMSLNEGLAECLDIIRPTLAPGVKVRILGQGPDVMIGANQGGLNQVLINLVRNAADAMSDSGEIEISSGQTVLYPRASDTWSILPGRYGYIKVADSGSGLDPDIAGKVFDPFFSTKPTGKGTGLGLSVVAGLVREWGGAIDVESEPGKTVFTIYIPATERQQAAAE